MYKYNYILGKICIFVFYEYLYKQYIKLKIDTQIIIYDFAYPT